MHIQVWIPIPTKLAKASKKWKMGITPVPLTSAIIFIFFRKLLQKAYVPNKNQYHTQFQTLDWYLIFSSTDQAWEQAQTSLQSNQTNLVDTPLN